MPIAPNWASALSAVAWAFRSESSIDSVKVSVYPSWAELPVSAPAAGLTMVFLRVKLALLLSLRLLVEAFEFKGVVFYWTDFIARLGLAFFFFLAAFAFFFLSASSFFLC